MRKLNYFNYGITDEDGTPKGIRGPDFMNPAWGPGVSFTGPMWLTFPAMDELCSWWLRQRGYLVVKQDGLAWRKKRPRAR